MACRVPDRSEDRRARGCAGLLACRPDRRVAAGLTPIVDKGLARQDFEDLLNTRLRLHLIRPDRRDEAPQRGSIGWIRHWIESINGQLDIERHGGQTPCGLYACIT